MRILRCIIGLFFSFSLSVNAQTVIKGIITEGESGQVFSGANVMVQEKKATGMLNYSLSNAKGAYKLSFTSKSDSVVITITGFNIKKTVKTVANQSQDLNFKIATQAIELKEVKITPPKIRQIGDTINYSVDGYTDKNDRTIGDVLKKMPGIEVKESGAILYNNKPINKFYIEDKDLLQGRYGIATNNIEAKDVSTVQVLENHQPIKALKDTEFSEDAALNLKLKDSAKGVIIANALVGAGLPTTLWNNELSTMYFDKKQQNITTYKGNNSGDNVSRDLIPMYSYGGDGGQTGSSTNLAIQSPATPPISQKRYLFNRAHAISTNNLWTIGKEYQLNANINYMNDRQERNSYSRSTYYLPEDSLLQIEERLYSKTHINQADAEVRLNANTEKFYLNNVLKLNGAWNDADGRVLSVDTISQHLNNPSYGANNTFQLVKKQGKRDIHVYSYTAYNLLPQTLRVNPVLYSDLFDKSKNWESMNQELKQNNFISQNRLSFGYNKKRWLQDYTIGFDASLQHLNSGLKPQTINGQSIHASDSLSNDLQWNNFKWYVNPSFTYILKNLRTTLELPASFHLLQINDKIPAQNKNTSRFFLDPAISFRYEFDAFWAASARAAYNNSLGGINKGYTGYIMRSYRNLLRNEGSLLEQQNQSYNLSLNYRHPIHALFGNWYATYNNTKANILYGSDYRGILSIQKTFNIPNTAKVFYTEARISKGIDAISSTLSTGVNYSNSKASQISQDEIIHFKNEQYGISSEIVTKIQSWSSFSYRFNFTENQSRVLNNENEYKPIRTSNQNAGLAFFPMKGLTLSLAYEYFYNSAISSGDKTMSFADLGIKYKWKNTELALDYTNIFNSKQYVSANYSDISTLYYTYDLRPAEVLLKVRFKLK